MTKCVQESEGKPREAAVFGREVKQARRRGKSAAPLHHL